MIHQTRFLLFFLALSSGMTRIAEAKYSEALAKKIELQVSAAESALNATEEKEEPYRFPNLPDPYNPDRYWYFMNIWVRLRPYGGVAFPWIAQINIVPEFDFLWQRQPPEGWSVYRPLNLGPTPEPPHPNPKPLPPGDQLEHPTE